MLHLNKYLKGREPSRLDYSKIKITIKTNILMNKVIKISILAGVVVAASFIVIAILPDLFREEVGVVEAQFSGCSLIATTPLAFVNASSTGTTPSPMYAAQIPVPSACIDGVCTVIMTRVLSTTAGPVTEVVRSMNIFQQSAPAGPVAPQSNWSLWTKPGEGDGVNCGGGANGTLVSTGGCNQLMQVLSTPKIDLLDDASIPTIAFQDLNRFTWTIRDADNFRTAQLFVCDN